ncbi:glycoside hydrolase family 75 protein [Streptomyces sp. SHP 1-2]|nr:glycoside hydrolase family 75 protein [Streptomyces sp. SHP 1-2]
MARAAVVAAAVPARAAGRTGPLGFRSARPRSAARCAPPVRPRPGGRTAPRGDRWAECPPLSPRKAAPVCVRSLTLALAGAALLAPALPATPAHPHPGPRPPARPAPAPAPGPGTGTARGTAPLPRAVAPPVRRGAPHAVSRGHRGAAPSGPARKEDAETPVRAADLLARMRDCDPVSSGRYRPDAGAPADIPVCGTSDAVFWKADLDIDCDGRPGEHCNADTDPHFTDATAYTGPDGRPLDAERLPYVVVPEPSEIWDHREHGIGGGSVAAVVYEDRVGYAVVGDVGPRDLIGEASYAAAESLGIDTDPRAGGAASGVSYIVFKDSRAEPIDDPAAAVAAGERLARRFADGG